MAKYYKGIIINVNDICIDDEHIVSYIVPEDYDKYYISHNGDNYFCMAKTAGNKIYNDFKQYFDKDDQDSRKKLDDYAKSIYDSRHKISGDNIIYEKVFDEDGKAYAKELISGKIFPISDKISSYNFRYAKWDSEYSKVFIDKVNNIIYYLYSKPLCLMPIYGNGEKTLFANNHKLYNDMKMQTDCQIINSLSLNSGEIIYLHLVYPESYKIKFKPAINISANQIINFTILNEEIATELEVQNYFERFKGVFKHKLKKEFINNLSQKSASNYLGDDVQLNSMKIAKLKIEEGQFTKEAQELEFILSKLKSVSENDFEIISKEYNELLNHFDDIFALTPIIQRLISLQNKAKLAYMCQRGNCKQIIEFLEKQAGLYINSCANDSSYKTKMTISELDNISERVLLSKFGFNFKEQNDILRHLALLYFLEIYENRDIITSDALRESYVNNNIKRIITIIKIFVDDGIIQDCNVDIYNIDNISELLDLIKEIKLNISSEEELVKKISI